MKAHSVKYILLCLLSQRENISSKDYKELFLYMERDQNDETNKTPAGGNYDKWFDECFYLE